ncbi:enoyl-CoA hydratase [Pararhizobium capsulatum DSM 1112]|uniref:Enoyl-CoA hydratase n=1 Tax=Pararhizobium capsulatum DSM 1112 TaxID=1121113 RepID=A0ABU0BW95_9HYPH|nr:enoyl-CoA hydratase [Pararhizobium capsulatum]MDQ0322527.1 enoyl-CoA hydratase [Pararhizobium capsulatum DSM 1112]
MEQPIIIERLDRVVVVTLNRPAARNALNAQIMQALGEQLAPLDRDPDVGCFVIKGSDKAFAAGADIKEMAERSYTEMYLEDYFAAWDRFTALRTPKIAAVSGYALGGGCELAMMCDIIFAADTAMFGQPEIKLGVIPGMGGSQRLTRLIGKAKAMDMILTGRMMDATEAERCGLAARVIPADRLMEETLDAARTIAGYGKMATMTAREAVERAMEVGLREGLLYERRAFHALFATADQKEGMAAFIEKRPPAFKGA